MSRNYDVVILGAGAAGLLCAAMAGARGKRVCVLERSPEPGRKILISGGGRCNFTNVHTRPEHFISRNPHFHKSALARYTPEDFIALVRKHRIAFHEKKLGQLFCDGSARQIVRMLLDEAAAAGVEIVLDCAVTEVTRDTAFQMETNRGPFRAPALVVATGGLSIPKMGATSFGYDLARRFGLDVVPTRPALVPLTFSERDRAEWADLAGVALETVASCGGQSFREKMLITHRGLSGPAILQISSHWDGAAPVHLDALPGVDLEAEVEARRRAGDGSSLKTILSGFVPKRFAERWLDLARAGSASPSLHDWQVTPAGTEGYAKAEVTAGGVHTDELSSKTMQSRRVPGLFFIGEVVDVTGQLGGFNFQWAWASAAAAASFPLVAAK